MQVRKTLHHEFEVPIYYEDTDFTGYVYHANYLKFFDRAREQMFGLSKLKELYEHGYHFVVKSAKLDFHKPAKHGDVLTISSKALFDHPVLVSCHHNVYVLSDFQKVHLATGFVELVTLNKKGKPTRIPPLGSF